MATEKSAGAVVYRLGDDRRAPLYLLLHYAAGHWDLPKGKIEEGETVKETARREISEETGITQIEFAPGFETKIKYSFKRENKPVNKTVVFLLARTKEKNVELSSEHTGFEWLGFAQAMEKLTYGTARSVLSEADAFLRVWR